MSFNLWVALAADKEVTAHLLQSVPSLQVVNLCLILLREGERVSAIGDSLFVRDSEHVLFHVLLAFENADDETL